MLTLQLAWKNTIGAGIRTWLNVIVLSVAFVTIIGMQGLYTGMLDRARDAMIRMELGDGQFWHPEYDPYDPFALSESHSAIPANLRDAVATGDAIPVLITQGSIFPEGRIKPILLKGIPPEQTILEIPTQSMVSDSDDDIPALIGSNMAENSGLSVGDYITVRWRDVNGTYDAADVRIAHIMETIVQSVDNGQIWLPLDRLHAMTGMENQATLIVSGEGARNITSAGNWIFRDIGFLTKEIDEIQEMSDSSLSIMYFFLLGMGLLAVFDTQVLSLWRRRKEMGTMMALGMTRGMLIRLFTLEGAMHAILAILAGAVYGIPLLTWFANTGFTMPEYVEDYGMALGRTMYPTYGLQLVIGTVILVFITVTIVSYLPTRKIAKLEPTDALRGKFS